MVMINTFWAILPPLIAIALALITKEVYSSLMVGVIAGALFYTNFDIIGSFMSIFDLMASKIGDNASILIFLCLLGAIVVLMTKAGGSRAYGDWAARKIKTKRGAMLATSALGAIIFVDDYFNCLTVGTVMRPVTDSHNISRSKLAYIIDSTAAPICIIAPISSWAVSVGATIEGAGISGGFQVFMSTIPFNLYALVTIVMVVVLSCFVFDFGKMKKFDKDPSLQGQFVSGAPQTASQNGKVIDLVLPILILILTTLGLMVYTGIQGIVADGAEMSVANIFYYSALYNSMVVGAFFTLIIMLLMYVPRKLIKFNEFMGSIMEGVKSMMPAIVVLCLAWTLSGICSSDYLQTGDYVGALIAKSGMTLSIIPAIIFLVAGALAFSTGTSWGTFGILIPIIVIIFKDNSATLLTITIAATLAGAVFGDHISPISDTTILSSTGAECNHLDHVSTQLPYALLVAGCCFIGYLVAGFVQNWWLPLIVSFTLLGIAIFVIMRIEKKKDKIAKEETEI